MVQKGCQSSNVQPLNNRPEILGGGAEGDFLSLRNPKIEVAKVSAATDAGPPICCRYSIATAIFCAQNPSIILRDPFAMLKRQKSVETIRAVACNGRDFDRQG